MNDDLIGQTLLDQFRVERLVAAGDMSTAYQAWDLKRGIPLILTLLPAGLASHPDVLHRLEHEAQALKKLIHPHIVPYYGLYEDGGWVFQVERAINGLSLAEIMRQRQGATIPPREALSYLKGLCAALGHAHAKGIIHGRVQPGCVWVGRTGSIFLSGFGVAHPAEGLAPEQLRGKPVSAETDIYALGVLLFEMLTGQRPAPLDVAPPNPRALNPWVPQPLAAVIMKCMAQAPSERYASAAELFLAACQAVGAAPGDVADYMPLMIPVEQPKPVRLPGRAGPQPPVPGKRFARTLAGWGGDVALVLLVALLFLLDRVVSLNAASPQALPAALAAGSITQTAPLPTALASPTGPAAALPPSPTASVVPAASSGSADAPTRTPTAPPAAAPLPASTSPDAPGGKIVYRCEGNICIINADGSAGRCLTCGLLTGSTNKDPALTPDGQSVLFASGSPNHWAIYEVSLAGALKQITREDASAWEPVASPDGRQILFTRQGSGWLLDLWLMDRDGGNQRRFRQNAWAGAWSADGQTILFLSSTTEGDQLYTRGLLNGVAAPLARAPANPGRGDWFSAGHLIVTASTSIGLSQIFLVSDDGTQLKLISPRGGSSQSPSFSPDGKWVSFAGSSRDPAKPDACSIFIMRTDGSEFHPLTQTHDCDSQPRWGP